MTFSLFKFFFGSTILEGDKYLSSYEGIQEDMEILGAAGFSKPYKFMRFKKTYEWAHWGYNNTTLDAAAWVPNKPVILFGFTLYAANIPEFQAEYKIYIDDKVVEEETIVLNEYIDKYYCR